MGYVNTLEHIPKVNTYLEATKNYSQYENEEGDEWEDNGDYYSSDEGEDMEVEKPRKNEPDEDGWTVARYSICYQTRLLHHLL